MVTVVRSILLLLFEYSCFKKCLTSQGNQALYKTHGKKYDVGCGSCILYAAPGVSMDWMADKAHIKKVFP